MLLESWLPGMRALLVDNHDSFTFNLYQLMAVVNGEAPVVVRNDAATWDVIERIDFDCIVISPGPGRPEVARDFGLSRVAIERSAVPLLGVCLGHQGIAWLGGGAVVPAAEVMHGRASDVTHGGDELFAGIPRRFRAVRYHSLSVDPALPDDLESIAWTDDGVVMGVRHRRRPLWGVQFHPESIGSEHGRRLLENFRAIWRDMPRGGERRSRRRTRRGCALRPAIPTGRARPRPSDMLELRWRRLDAAGSIPRRRSTAASPAARRAFWLDSSLIAPGLGRFSYMGDDRGPLAMRVRHDVSASEVVVTDRDGEVVRRRALFDCLREQLERRQVAAAALPFDFQCGFVGYLGYEMKAECGAQNGHRSPHPDAGLLFADRLVAFDHAERAVHLVCLSPRETAGDADSWLAETARALDGDARSDTSDTGDRESPLDWTLRRDRDRYLADIAAMHGGDPRRAELRAVSHQPAARGRAAWTRCACIASCAAAARPRTPRSFACPALDIVSSSPERFLTVDRERRVESRPIKGTRPRGATPEADAALAADLRAAPRRTAPRTS